MQIQMNVIEGPESGVESRDVDLSRMPVLGEYVRHGNEWYEVKRVLHYSAPNKHVGEFFAVPIVDPTRESLKLHEWLDPAP